MFLRFRSFTPKARVRRTAILQQTAFLASLSSLIVAGACGGGPSPVKATLPTAAPLSLRIAASLPAATQGTAYSGSVTASGGSAPYSFEVVSGQLPQGMSLSTSGSVAGIPSATGTFTFGLLASDAKGDSKQQSLQITVASAPVASAPSPAPTSPAPSSPAPSSPQPSNPPASNPQPSGNNGGGTPLSNLQRAGGWGQYGQGPPNFVDCSPSPCDGIAFSMTQNNSSPSLSGNSTVYWVGGTTPYSDALWNNHLIGPLSSQGMFDQNQSQLPNLHDFTYDVYFYGDNLEASQAVEFDINQFFGNMGFIFGHECRIAGGNEWDIWDNSKGKWVPTGVPCYPNSGQWNHVTLKVQRTSDNHETYESITLNGQTANLNWTFESGSTPGWYGLTVNFQMDGNSSQEPYKVYLDNLTLTYQ